MPDDIDRVQAQNETRQRDALDAHFRNRTTGSGSEICIECEEPIPEARRKAATNCTRCIDCQTNFEGNR
jgi:phage/conjugal plasmid C-4 type zinc finger TraR family protein